MGYSKKQIIEMVQENIEAMQIQGKLPSSNTLRSIQQLLLVEGPTETARFLSYAKSGRISMGGRREQENFGHAADFYSDIERILPDGEQQVYALGIAIREVVYSTRANPPSPQQGGRGAPRRGQQRQRVQPPPVEKATSSLGENEKLLELMKKMKKGG
ncbi:MAG TPA: hypothetical protein P5560_14130 [Thermotogota bacterium]|nr:hypothetical protein [Thermotogota bacterium]